MTIESPEKLSSLDLKHKLNLEAALMESMLGPAAIEDLSSANAWVQEYGGTVHNLLTASDEFGEKLRTLAVTDQYNEAVKLLEEKLAEQKTNTSVAA